MKPSKKTLKNILSDWSKDVNFKPQPDLDDSVTWNKPYFKIRVNFLDAKDNYLRLACHFHQGDSTLYGLNLQFHDDFLNEFPKAFIDKISTIPAYFSKNGFSEFNMPRENFDYLPYELANKFMDLGFRLEDSDNYKLNL